MSKRAAEAFAKLRPAGERAPLHHAAVGAIIACLLAQGERQAAETVAFGYDCCLRGGEWQTVRAHDVDVDTQGNVAVRLGVISRGEQTKTGPRQGVVPQEEYVRAILRARKDAAPPGAKLWRLPPASFYAAWHRACDTVGLADHAAVPHCLRHAAAAEAIRAGGFTEGAVRATQLRGRWKSLNSLRRYAKPHLLVSALADTPPATAELGKAFWADPTAKFRVQD